MYLKNKILLMTLLLVALPILFLGWYSIKQLDDTVLKARYQQLINDTERLVHFSELQTSLLDLKLAHLGNSDVLRKFMLDSSEDTKYQLYLPLLLQQFNRFQNKLEACYEVRILLPDGFEDVRVAKSGIENITEYEKEQPFFEDLLIDHQVNSHQLYRNLDNGKWALLSSTRLQYSNNPFASNEGNLSLRGFLAITCNIESLVENNQINNTLAIYSNNRGVILQQGQLSYREQFNSHELQLIESSIMEKKIKRGELFGRSVHLLSHKNNYGLTVTLAVDNEKLLVAGKNLRTAIIYTSFVMLLISMVAITLYLQKLLLVRIQQIRIALEKLANRNYNIKLNITEADELSELSESVNILTQQLKQYREKVQIQLKEIQQAKEQAEKSNQIKSDFLAMMTHELRTPMNAVLGMTELMRQTTLSDNQKRYMRYIKEGGVLLLGIINDILDFSKIEAGKLDLESKPFNLEVVLKDILSLLSVAIEKRGIDCKLVFNPEITEVLMGDETRLKQILLNLIGNAIKFTEQGGIILEAELITINKQNTTLCFHVHDTGIGIQQDKLEHIFEAFNQADNSTTRRFGGTGLGLSISADLIQMMGGKIQLESTEGQGSHFFFELTFDNATLESKIIDHKTNKSELKGIFSQQKLKLLLAEDNLVNQILLKEMLEYLGLQCETVENGLAAKNACIEQTYDIILMDIQMDIMDGMESCQKIRQQQHIKQPYIIAVSANILGANKKQYQAIGMNDYISKPVDLQTLYQAIKQAITISN